MRRRVFLLLIAVSTLFLGATAFAAGNEPAWQAGFAKAKITPEPGLWMAGYAARDHAADGALHDLWIKALALEDAKGRHAVLVSMDLLGVPQSMYANVCKRVEKRSGVSQAALMLCASHTHSGPVLRGALLDIYPLDDEQIARIEKYSAGLETTVVETVARALADLQSAQLAVGTSEATFGANRRALRTGATGDAAPTDPTVPVLSVRSDQGKLRTIVFGYACHNTTLDIYRWNGDYAGFAQLDLQSQHPGAEAMFVAGCGADQNPNPRRTVELCEQHGLALADAVSKALAGPMEPVAPKLKTAMKTIDLPYGEQPGVEQLKKTAEGSNYAARWARRLLAEIEAGKSFAKSYPAYPVEVWQLGQFRLVALGGEVVVDYALKLRSRLGENTWVAAYSNDVMAYIPSSRVRTEGGYEAGAFNVYGLPAVSWAPDIEDRIVNTVEALVAQLENQ